MDQISYRWKKPIRGWRGELCWDFCKMGLLWTPYNDPIPTSCFEFHLFEIMTSITIYYTPYWSLHLKSLPWMSPSEGGAPWHGSKLATESCTASPVLNVCAPLVLWHATYALNNSVLPPPGLLGQRFAPVLFSMPPGACNLPGTFWVLSINLCTE